MRNSKEQRILNLGCGKDTYGTDFVDLYPSRPGVLKCNIENERLPYKDNTFDKVVAYGLLQHITNLPNFFNECKRVLKKGGTLEILTANAGFWGVFGRTFYGKYDETIAKEGMTEGKAYLLFTTTSLHNLLQKYRFGNITCNYEIASKNKRNNPYHLVAIRTVTILSPRFYPHIKAVATK